MTMFLKVNIFLLVLMAATMTVQQGRFYGFNDEYQRYQRGDRKFPLSLQTCNF